MSKLECKAFDIWLLLVNANLYSEILSRLRVHCWIHFVLMSFTVLSRVGAEGSGVPSRDGHRPQGP